jgi:DNA-binding XRE family transcriptional regulator
MRPKRKGAYRKVSAPKGRSKRQWTVWRKELFNRNVTYAAAIKYFRIASDVTQAELARALRVKTGTIVNRESGKMNLTPEIIRLHMLECERLAR